MSIPEQHRRLAGGPFCCGVLTISDSRTPATDRGGDLLVQLLTTAGHQLMNRDICPDEPAAIRTIIHRWIDAGNHDAVLLTGGTGISPRDHTYETISAMLTKPLPGYGELFRWLSYQEIGPAAMLSRALGGLVQQTVVLTMPGSPAAIQLAMEKLILPELGHLVQQARKGLGN